VNVHAPAAAARALAAPPFRAEHIGGLLRPPELLAARARFARLEIGQAALTVAEDAAIRGAIALQARLGFKLVTDGEFRRRSYHGFFYSQLGRLAIDTIAGADARGGRAGAAPSRSRPSAAACNGRTRSMRPMSRSLPPIPTGP